MKVCRLCFRDLPLSEFHKNSRRADGLKSECRDCSAVKFREFYETHAPYVRAAVHSRYLEHGDEIRARRREAYAEKKANG